MRIFLILVIGFLFSIIALKYFIVPYILIAACWLLLFIILTLTSKSVVSKSVWFNFTFVVFLLGALETYSYFSLYAPMDETIYSEGYRTSNEILGYGPARNKITTARKLHRNLLVYDVTYTIGDDSLRITPPAISHYEDNCILIFGGSFTFGEGVDDHHSMPYIVGTLQPNKVYNYGFHGYGPHQMLSAIENGMIDCKPKLVIYQAISGHVERAAGHSSWDRHGPMYVLQNGRLGYNGRFDDQENKLANQLEKSSFFRKFIKKPTDDDINIFLEIVDSSRGKLIEMFPEVGFHVVLWDHEDDVIYLKVKDGLEQRSIKYHLVSDMLPGYSSDKEKYFINHDGHPNLVAHQLMAEYFVKNIVSMNDSLISD